MAAGGVTSEVVGMSAEPVPLHARVSAKAEGDGLEVSLAGTWQITESRPSWAGVLGTQNPALVRLRVDEVGKWDSSLLLFLFAAQQWCRVTGAHCDTDALPEKIRTLLAEREPFYKQADVMLNTESRSIKTIAQQIAHQFQLAQAGHR